MKIVKFALATLSVVALSAPAFASNVTNSANRVTLGEQATAQSSVTICPSGSSRNPWGGIATVPSGSSRNPWGGITICPSGTSRNPWGSIAFDNSAS